MLAHTDSFAAPSQSARQKLPSTQTDKHGCFSQSRLALCLIYSPASDPGRAELDGLLAPLLLLQLDTHILM